MQSLSDQFLAHQIYLQRYSSQEAYKVQPFIKRMIKIIKDEVLKQEGTKLSNAKLRALLKDLNEQLYVVTGEWDAEIISDLEKFAAYETNWAAKAISTPLPDGVNFVVPTPEQAWAAVQFAPLELNEKPVDFAKMMSSWAPSEVERLTMGVKTGFLRGTPTKEIVRQVVGVGGLADISRRNAEAIVRTAVNHVSTQAKEQVYARNSDIITGYEWVSTLDSRTSSICRARDSNVYEIGKGPLPPAHYCCRSTTAPTVSSEFDFLDQGAKRAAKGADGGTQVDADVSYYDWLKSQPAAFQDDVLGKTKGAIFRNAGLSTEQFKAATVDRYGNPLTLEQMKIADKRVASYMNKQ